LVKQEDVSFKFPDNIDVVSSGRVHELVQAFPSKLEMFLFEEIHWRDCYEGGDKGVHSIPIIYYLFGDPMMVKGIGCHL